MEIPLEIQKKLKCSECDGLLSCGPVYMLHGTEEAICGRCSQVSEEAANSNRTRNGPYEATASLLVFPCAFASQGCPEKLNFSLGQSNHELICDFRPLICPIVPRGTCDWIGAWPTLMEHCKLQHETSILKNKSPFPRPDLTNSNLKTYLVSAFSFLFLFQIKVCVTSGKLYHSLCMFGDPKFLAKFSFTLDVEGNNAKFSKAGSVLRAGILAIQEPTAICTTINHLLGILDGKYDTAKFTITIQTLLNLFCLNCLQNIDILSSSKFCSDCQEKFYKCKFHENGCLFRDIKSRKCWTHETMFCENQTKCYYCDTIVSGSFITHLTSSQCCRRTVNAKIDSFVRVVPNLTKKYDFILFLDNNFGTIVSESYLTGSKFYQYFYTSLPSYEIKNFKCSIQLTDPKTKHTQLVVPQVMINTSYDWYFYENMSNFPSVIENVGIDMKITIEKN